MQTQDAISTRIDAMPFSTRVSNALRLMKIERIGDLAGLSEAYLMHSPNIGRKSLYEIKDALAEFGFNAQHPSIEPWMTGLCDVLQSVCRFLNRHHVMATAALMCI
jgi:DNA-directed RNA polymerase alpha subunit